jgi:hypothetical protein
MIAEEQFESEIVMQAVNMYLIQNTQWPWQND